MPIDREVFPSIVNKYSTPIGYSNLAPEFQSLFIPDDACPGFYHKHILRCHVSPYGVVFKNGFPVKESLPYMSRWRDNVLTFYKKIAFGRVTRIKGTCLAAINPYYTNYGHWLIESMPRIFSAHKMHSSVTMLIPMQAPRFVMQYLELFSFKDIYRVKENELVYCDEAILPNSLHFGQYHQTLMREMKSFLLKVSGNRSTVSRKILLSRDKAAYRKSHDEQNIFEALRAIGFEKLFAEDLSVIDQIAVFSSADFLAGIHSTGLNNCLFMPDRSTVVDFIVKDHYDISPYKISQVSQQRFCYVPCERTRHNSKMNYDDPILDVNKIVKTIGELIKK